MCKAFRRQENEEKRRKKAKRTLQQIEHIASILFGIVMIHVFPFRESMTSTHAQVTQSFLWLSRRLLHEGEVQFFAQPLLLILHRSL